MKVEELIKKLENFDGDLEVKTKERYSEGRKQVGVVKIEYENLNDKYVFIG